LNLSEQKRLEDFYDQRYDQFGYDVRSVGWGNKESQRLRFQILSDIADLTGTHVCDLGCGFGDLYPFLVHRFVSLTYRGIDLSAKLVEEARQRYPDVLFEKRNILERPLLEKVDYVLASGALSFKMPNHERYVEQMLAAMMSMSRRGVGVNFLSTYVDYQLEKNFHWSPEQALSCGRRLTRYVTIRHDYPLYEFTMYLFHQPSAG